MRSGSRLLLLVGKLSVACGDGQRLEVIVGGVEYIYGKGLCEK